MPNLFNVIAAVDQSIEMSKNERIGYSQTNRLEQLYRDCSSNVIRNLNDNGFKLDPKLFTGTMYPALIAAGFTDVSKLVNKKTGEGSVKGDIWLRPPTKTRGGHTAFNAGNGNIIQLAGDLDHKPGDSSGKEYCVEPFYTSANWKYCLRFIDVAAPVPTPAPIPSAVPAPTRTYEEGDIVVLNGKGCTSADGRGAKLARSTRQARIIHIAALSNPYPYALNYTNGSWIDAWFEKGAFK